MKPSTWKYTTLVAACLVLAPTALAGQDLERCTGAEQLLSEQFGMVTRVDADTLDDWRTGQTLEVCRVTAAGIRTASIRVAARQFYDRVRAVGWTRTPDPRDAPNEASLRFRQDQTDCLFNVYQGILLGTPSEIEVTNAVEVTGPEERYHVLVICTPAMDAKPRGNPS